MIRWIHKLPIFRAIPNAPIGLPLFILAQSIFLFAQINRVLLNKIQNRKDDFYVKNTLSANRSI